ncbi:MAG TPA: ORF6N domain-containing protein [Firmicutes bacterium]|nr:ORF6N domain-containing protein [Bacillota bacterium]
MNAMTVTINDTDLTVKEYQGQRVVTFREIDQVHGCAEGRARKRFNDNKAHFIEGEDFFVRNPDEAKNEFGIIAPNGLTLITESGYLMLVKSFTDDLAWKVQRQLVKAYFRAKGTGPDLSGLSPELRLLINLELRQKEQERALEAANTRIDRMGDIVALSPNSWRPDAHKLIIRIAQRMGGNEYIRDVQAEIFKLVNERAGVSLDTRLTNKRRRMAEEGVCKSKRDKLTRVDVIADDKKLIEIYVAIIKEMAVKYGIAEREAV